jgi:hypothetical protein
MLKLNEKNKNIQDSGNYKIIIITVFIEKNNVIGVEFCRDLRKRLETLDRDLVKL